MDTDVAYTFTAIPFLQHATREERKEPVSCPFTESNGLRSRASTKSQCFKLITLHVFDWPLHVNRYTQIGLQVGPPPSFKTAQPCSSLQSIRPLGPDVFI